MKVAAAGAPTAQGMISVPCGQAFAARDPPQELSKLPVEFGPLDLASKFSAQPARPLDRSHGRHIARRKPRTDLLSPSAAL